MIRAVIFALAGAVLGAVVGHLLWFLPVGPLVLVGPQVIALMAFFKGWSIGIQMNSSAGVDPSESNGTSDACLSLLLSSGAVTVTAGMWSWVAIQPMDRFHDQGGMTLTLLILPWTIALWFAGGPLSFRAARRALKQLRRSSVDRRFILHARIGVAISSMIIAGGLVSLAAFVCLAG